MRDRRGKLENRKERLERRIRVAEKYKKHLIDSTQELLREHDARRIDRSEYYERLDALLEGKSIGLWVSYYDRYIEDCRTQL